ncbi:MAG TPA: hypothetical protein VNU96_09045 [Burkholderiales bacterium]|jgi:hypothetical protein|nr:hypothetical protein [Burkholderiales bacterium]
MNFYRSLFAAAALFAATTGSAQDRCRAMLNGAPENVLQLEAVRDCRGTDAACGYMGSASGHGALTLICPVSGVSQVLGADRLKSLRVRNGTLVGECSSGSWGRDASLPGCYR